AGGARVGAVAARAGTARTRRGRVIRHAARHGAGRTVSHGQARAPKVSGAVPSEAVLLHRSLSRCLLIAVLFCCALSAHAVDGVTDTSIRLGMSSPFSGPTGAYGRAMKEGIEACFAAVNARGGIEGRKLELVALDDGYETDAAVANAKRLIGQDRV